MLITSQKKKHLFLIRSAKFRERIDAAVDSAQRASKYALQKADIAISRTATARGKAEMADSAADHARVDSEVAITTAREFAPDFKPSLLERFERIRVRERFRPIVDEPPGKLLVNDKMTANKTTNNSLSPNKPTLNQQAMQHQQQQQQQQQQQNLLNPQATIRRTSMNPSMKQTSLDFQNMNNTMYSNNSNQSNDYGNSLGTNQQFGQPQPPGNNAAAFNSPQKFSQSSIQPQQQQQQQQSSATAVPSQNYTQHHQVSTQQPQQNQSYLNNNNSNLQQQQQQQQQHPSHHQQQNIDSYNSNFQQPAAHYQTSPQNYHDGNPQQSAMGGGYGGNDMVQNSMRRNSKMMSDSGRPMLGAINQTSIDHFDHYKRPPSRDSSVDRYSRAASRLGGSGGSRQPSVDRVIQVVQNAAPILSNEVPIDRGARAGSQFRGTTPVQSNLNGSVMTGAGNPGSRRGSRSGTPVFQGSNMQPNIQQIQAQYSSPNQPFEDVLLRQRTLGQDIIPSPGQPKRTESLFVPNKPLPSGGGGGGGGGGGAKGKGLKVTILDNYTFFFFITLFNCLCICQPPLIFFL